MRRLKDELRSCSKSLLLLEASVVPRCVRRCDVTSEYQPPDTINMNFVDVKQKLRIEKPEQILEKAVAGMLPDNKLKQNRMKRLHIVIGTEHPYGQHLS